MEKIKLKLEVQYNGHSIKKNGIVSLGFLTPYSELVSVLTLTQLINADIKISARVNSDKPFSLGNFMLSKITIDREGESKLQFDSTVDSAELDNFADLTTPETIINLLVIGTIEDEEE